MLASVIKYEGDNNTFLWKHPQEDFNTGTQLIVHESQEAIFFMNGQALDSFGPGRYTLQTQNIPLIAKFFNLVTGGDTPFHCEVYFANKTEQMAIKWGTPSSMEFMEPTYGFPIKIGASGEMNLRIENARQLLLKVVGTEAGLLQTALTANLRSFLLQKVKQYIVRLIRENNLNIFQIDEHLEVISQALHDALKIDFQEYGIALEQFFVLNIAKPEDDKNYQRFRDIHFRQYADIAEAKIRQQVGVIDQQTAARRMVIDAEGKAQKRQLEGYTYQDERRFDVAEQFASNQATGELANLGVGIGMISGIGESIGNSVGGIVSGALATLNSAAAEAKKCLNRGTPMSNNAKFCLECGTAVPAAQPEQIICPKCNKPVAAGKFCPQCGAPLARQCPQCGKNVPTEAKFCQECGTKLN